MSTGMSEEKVPFLLKFGIGSGSRITASLSSSIATRARRSAYAASGL